MLLLADVDEYSFANTEFYRHRVDFITSAICVTVFMRLCQNVEFTCTK